MNTKYHQLKDLLLQWRSLEKEHARAVLTACHPDVIVTLANNELRALHKLRLFVDREPWGEIETE